MQRQSQLRSEVLLDSKDFPWEIGLRLDVNECKGPFILALSQPLKVNFVTRNNSKTNSIINEFVLKALTPLSGEKLEATVDKIPNTSSLTIVFGGGLNYLRHAVIDSIQCQEMKLLLTQSQIETQAKIKAKAEEEAWFKNNEVILENINKKRKDKIKIFPISQLMENKDFEKTLNKLKLIYENKSSAKLNKIIDNAANEISKLLYADLFRFSQNMVLTSAIDNSVFTEESLKTKLTQTTKEYVFFEFAVLGNLALKNKTRCLLYPILDKADEIESKKSPKRKTNRSAFNFASPLLNLVLDLVDPREKRDKQLRIIYKEFEIVKREISKAMPSTVESVKKISQFSGNDLLALFHLIAALPAKLTKIHPPLILIWFESIQVLDKRIGDALSRAAYENSVLELSKSSESKSYDLDSAIDSSRDLDSLIVWMGTFLALTMADQEASHVAIVPVNHFMSTNLNPELNRQIRAISMNAYRNIKSNLLFNFGKLYDSSDMGTGKSVQLSCTR